MKTPFSRKARAPEPAPESDVETALLDAARDCDAALAALSDALARRRQALVKATAATRLEGHSVLTRCFSPSMVWAAFAHHGAGILAGLPHVQAAHKRSFEASARAALDASRDYRKTTAPAASGIEKEQRREAVA